MPEKKALISLHDVMPGTLPRVEEILQYLREIGIPPITLLIVPGCKWSEKQVHQIKALAGEGYELAAHGWIHQAYQIKSLYHHLHAFFISRRVAEHLALDSRQILDLMLRSADWFQQQGLPTPSLYVPPAWALGSLKQEHRLQLPYSRIELLNGFLDPKTGELEKVPMVGFEADTLWRAFWVRRWNSWQHHIARKTGTPIRIGIHPNDFRLRLADELRDLLRSQA